MRCGDLSNNEKVESIDSLEPMRLVDGIPEVWVLTEIGGFFAHESII
jgi:hypothetical protein